MEWGERQKDHEGKSEKTRQGRRQGPGSVCPSHNLRFEPAQLNEMEYLLRQAACYFRPNYFIKLFIVPVYVV